MTQTKRRLFLIEYLLSESGERIGIPTDEYNQKRLLRSLFNIRMPKDTSAEFLKIQDAYLQEENRRKGITDLADLEPVQDGIYLWQGDITTLKCGAVVNAANSQMLGCFNPCHGCIDNAIHTFAGIQLRAECSRKMDQLRAEYGRDYEQPTAVPMLTDGYNLPARKVIHIVGPIVSGPLTEELEQDLADCYTNTLDLCPGNGIRSVAFCCISTGVFRFPNRRAAEIAVRTVTEWLDGHPDSVRRVIFNVFKEEDKRYYEQELF